jgi:hypothetical protein
VSGWPAGAGPTGADTGHLDEAISAYLDGELDAHSAQLAYQHLSICGYCRSELDALSVVRTTLRSAPPIEPPFGFIERAISQRRRRPVGPVVAAVVGLAALWLLVAVVLGGGPLQVVPPVGNIADAQAELEPDQADEVDGFQAGAIEFDLTGRQDIPDEFRAPEAVGDAQYDAGFRAVGRDGWLAVYVLDDETVTVYQQLGEYEVGSLPGGGERFEVDGDPAWRSAVDGRNVVVVQRGGMTYTIVGDADVEDLIELAEELPARDDPESPSLGDRLSDAVEDFLEAFSLGA